MKKQNKISAFFKKIIPSSAADVADVAVDEMEIVQPLELRKTTAINGDQHIKDAENMENISNNANDIDQTTNDVEKMESQGDLDQSTTVSLASDSASVKFIDESNARSKVVETEAIIPQSKTISPPQTDLETHGGISQTSNKVNTKYLSSDSDEDFLKDAPKRAMTTRQNVDGIIATPYISGSSRAKALSKISSDLAIFQKLMKSSSKFQETQKLHFEVGEALKNQSEDGSDAEGAEFVEISDDKLENLGLDKEVVS